MHRVADPVTTCVIGVTWTKACNQSGIVEGLTKMLLPKVSGNKISMLTPITEFCVRIIRPNRVQIHE